VTFFLRVNLDKALCQTQRKDVIEAENITAIDGFFLKFFVQFLLLLLGVCWFVCFTF